MKTNIIIRTAVIFAALSCLFGCTNPEIELRKGLEIQIRPSTILSGFTPYRSDHLEMLDGSHLRITCLLYDRNGNLAYQEQSLLDNFDQDVTFCTTLDEKNGNYTIIALATCILGTLSSPTYEAYTISGTESLNQLCVEQEFDSSLSSTWSIMGYATQTISFDDSTISLNMQPATSLVYLYWQDIFAHDVIDDYFIIYHSNDIMRFDNNGTPIYSSLSSTGIHGANVSPADYSVKNIYRMCNLFPGSSMNIFAMAFSGNNYTSSPTQKFTVVSGHQYVFSLDCATFKLTPYEGVFGTRASCDEFEPIAVKSLPSLQHIDFPKKQFK